VDMFIAVSNLVIFMILINQNKSDNDNRMMVIYFALILLFVFSSIHYIGSQL